jgi:hypothetical protein
MKNNNFDMDFLLREAMRSSAMPDTELVQKVKNKTFKEESVMIKKSTARRSFGAAAVIAAVLLTVTTAFAAWHFLKPSDVAEKVSDPALSNAFNGDGAMDIDSPAITSGGYTFTLLGVVSGSDISDRPYGGADVQGERTYAVVAIQNADGTPFQRTEYNPGAFFASPLARGGGNPSVMNIMTLNGAYADVIEDGVVYRLVECDGMAQYARRGLYFAVSDGGPFYNGKAFLYDVSTGVVSANPEYSGSSAVFELPKPSSAETAVVGEPRNGDITIETAIAAAKTSLAEEYALSDELFERFTTESTTYFAVLDDGSENVWWVSFYPRNGADFAEIGCYTAVINAQTGDVLQLLSTADGMG